MNRLYVISLLSCLLWWGLSACGGLTQPQGERVTQSPLASPTAKQLVHSSVATPTPPLATATSTAIVTPSPTLYLPTLTPTSNIPTPTPTVIPQLTLDQAKLGSPVTELVYKISQPVENQSDLRLTTIWRADVTDIAHPQAIITVTHRRNNFLQDLTLSPDNHYLIFGQRHDYLKISLINLETGEVIAVDSFAAFHNNSHPYFWKLDSQSFVFTKQLDEWFSTAIYEYSVEAGQTTELFQADGHINLVGRQEPLIYYLLSKQSVKPYTINSLNIETMQIQPVYTLSLNQRKSYIAMSPDGTLALFSNIVVDLMTKRLFAESSLGRSLWTPDSQGLVVLDPYDEDTTIQFKPLRETYEQPLTFSFESTDPPGELLAWSPDGQYLIYHPPQTEDYYLLHTVSGQVQQFTPEGVFDFGGWISE